LSFTSTALYAFIAWTERPLTSYPLTEFERGQTTDGVLNTSDRSNIQALRLTSGEQIELLNKWRREPPQPSDVVLWNFWFRLLRHVDW
jgi:hypothetical protein